MRFWFTRVLLFFIRCLLRLRYKITVKGLGNLRKDKLKRSGGVLFMPNHPSIFTDAMLGSAYTYAKFRPRALITEYMYYTPGIYTIMQWINALPIPSLENAPNSYKRHRNEKSFQTSIDGLKQGENFLIYPAGRTKSTGLEIVGGASGVHRLLHNVPEANVVLVRITGLWGSIFSRAITGRPPKFWETIWFGIKTAAKAGFFFLPRREVTFEFEVASDDFPRDGTRIELNRYLESWYNRPYERTLKESKPAGEPLTLVSYSPWREKLAKITAKPAEKQKVDLGKVNPKTQELICNELAKLSRRKPEDITPEMNLAGDLGLDSLDGAEIIAFMEEKLHTTRVHPEDLTTVRQLFGIASGQVKGKIEEVEEAAESLVDRWRAVQPVPPREIPEGKTIGEIFLRSCDRLGKWLASEDPRGGLLTYQDYKMRALLMAEEIRQMPGDRIGIMLPASAGAAVLIFACILARKTPVMVNWTLGSRHLETVVELSGIEVVLTAWAFVDRLDNVDLTPIHGRIVIMEEVGYGLTLTKKIRALLRSRRSADTLIWQLRLDEVNPESHAVILFTSGTEKAPKGVPLTHANVVANMRATVEIAPFNESDIGLAMLPPFHSFGFVLTGVLPLVCGVRLAFSPDPTDNARIAREIERWRITLLIGAPTFLKGILKAGTKEQFKTIRLVMSGAEQISPEVVAMTKELGEHVIFMEGYGITECSPVITMQLVHENHSGVGCPIPGVKIKVVRPDSHEALPVGERGLLLVHGPNVFGGYLAADKVGHPFEEIDGERWYNTGDLGILDKMDCLKIAGRLKRFVKIGGEMISLTAIEAALMEVAVKKGWPTPVEGPTVAVCALEIVDTNPELFLFTKFEASAEEINGILKEEGFSNLVRVSEVYKLQEIPMTGTGKTNYRALEDKYLKSRKPVR